MRTHLCGEVNESLLAQTVAVCGWARARRDHGGVIFIDLRDRGGVLQLVADPAGSQKVFAAAETVRNEYVLRAVGTVCARPAGTVNDAMPSGKVEVRLTELEILNPATALPFAPDDAGISEEARLRHRVLDLRGGKNAG